MLLNNKFPKKLALALAAIGPGLFLIAYNIGTGSIVTMSKAGAEYGMTLFWAVALSCIFTFVLMVAYGKVTIVSGETALRNFRAQMPGYAIGTILAVYIIIALIIGELLALLGIIGIVSELLQEGTRLIWGDEVNNKNWITILIALGLGILFWTGNYKRFEKIFTFFVFFMMLCFMLSFFLIKPDLGVIVSGLVPRIPREPGALGLIAAMAGTTVSAAVFIIRSTIVAEKGWTRDDIPAAKKDAAVSAGTMLLLSGMIMAVSAGTLHVMGYKLNNTVELIQLFEPIGGKFAAFILILGISAAGISTIFPIVLIAPWLIADFRGTSRDIRSPMFRILGLGGILFALISLFIEQRPPAVMIFSQAFQAFILPAVVLPIFWLVNKSELMNEHKASVPLNIGLLLTLLFSLMTAYFSVAEFIL